MMDDLREKVAELLFNEFGCGDWIAESAIVRDQYRDVATDVLAIPEIAEALKAQERLVGKPLNLGHSISTRPPA